MGTGSLIRPIPKTVPQFNIELTLNAIVSVNRNLKGIDELVDDIIS